MNNPDHFITDTSGLITIFIILLGIIVGLVFAIRALLLTTRPSTIAKWKSDTTSNTLTTESGHENAGAYANNARKSAEQMHEDKRQYPKKKQSE